MDDLRRDGVQQGQGRQALRHALRRYAVIGVMLTLVLAGFAALPGGASAETYEEAVEHTSGVSHFWPMGESSGSLFADVVGGADAGVSGGVTLGESGGLVEDVSTSAAFDGTSGAAEAPVDLTGTHELTVEFWMKWHAYGSDDRLALEFTPNFNHNPGGFLVDPDATPGSDFVVTIGGDGSYNDVSFARPGAEQWHYYAFVIDTGASAEGEITPYVDGVPVSYTKTHSEAITGDFADSSLYWMSRDASELFGKGSMQDLALYDTTLSSSTILEHYEQGDDTYRVVNTTAPSIEGTAKDGQTLTADRGSWTGFEPISYAYRWQRCNSSGGGCTNISGATGSTYTLGHSDVGHTIRIIVTASNAGSSAESTSEKTSAVAVLTPSDTTLPAISGTTKDGQILSVSTGEWSGTPPLEYSYQWQSCNLDGEECNDLEGARGQTYTPAASDLETTLRVVVTAANAGGSAHATSAASADVESGPPSESEPPWISGDPDEGETLDGEAGQWGGTENEIDYQWERCNSTGGECAVVAGATEADYKLTEGDVGKTLRLRVGASNVQGAMTAVSPATEVIGAKTTLMNTWAPSITGTPQNGHVLSANAGSWLGVTSIGYTYQWQKCSVYGVSCENITGATSSTYTLGSESVGSTIRFRVQASEAEGSVYETSTATQPIAASAAPVVEDPPSVSGTGLVGDVITAVTGSWASEGSVSYSYQWERCNEYGESCGSISGATASTYTLTESDAGHTVRVLVTGTAGEGSTKAVSYPLAVSATTLADVVAPSISGSAEADRALNADRGIWTAAGALSYSYQWKRCNEHGESCSSISEATKSSYTPGSADVGHELTVVVTATGTAGTESVASAATPVIAAGSIAPENTRAPAIEGDLTSGETLTAQTGTWVSSETITYSYQWQRCNEGGEECTNISGATSSAYKLIGGDVGSTMRVVVTGTNSLGSASATSYQSEVVGAVGPPAIDGEGPAIHGTTQVGQTVVAEVGQWSGSRPLTYTYRWERCNSSGESCTTIEHATKTSYAITSEDASHTLRVAVTATNTLGSATARSTTAAVSAAGEASTTPALELAEETDPSVLAPSETATLEGETVKPQIANSGELIAANTTLTSSTISKETPGEFAVNTSVGELSFEPLESSSSATTTPLIVNGATALYAGTQTATDTFVRPTPVGTTTLLQLRSAQAPRSFSWEVGLGADQELEKLPDGDVAVVEPSSGPSLESELPTGGIEPPEAESAETPGEEGQSKEHAETELESGLSEGGVLEKLSAAPQTTTPKTTPRENELHPQETKAQYERATSSLATAETETGGTTIMVIQAPHVLDAEGHSVPAALSVEGDTVTMTITPSETTKWPTTAELAVGAPTDIASSAKAHGAQYGLSDENASAFDSSEDNGNEIDHRLKEGPLHVKRARLALNWNTLPENPQLNEWLEAVKKAELVPYITIRICEPVAPSHTCPTEQPNLSTYRLWVRRLMKTLIHGTSSRPAVRLWGSWNEPEGNESPWVGKPKVAAYLWGETKRASEEAGCHHHCTVVAGEFSKYEEHHLYDIHYEEDILQAERKHKFPVKVKPHVWGMHDYADLENVEIEEHEGKEVIAKNYRNGNAQGFVSHTKRLYRDAHVWMSEQGALIEDKKGKRRLGKKPKLQRFAAKDFLRFGNASEHIEWAYYYEYRGPTNKKKFDSALLDGSGKEPEDWRPAYCVLALGREGCPAESGTKLAIASSVTTTSGTVAINVNPQSLATKYFVEYGLTKAYGKATTVTALPNEIGEQSETVGLNGLEPCKTYHYQAEAENEANEGKPGLGGDKTFATRCDVGLFGAKDGPGSGEEIWEVRGDGSEPHALGSEAWNGWPSPDGQSIAYRVYNGYENPPEIRIGPLGGSKSAGSTIYSYAPARADVGWVNWSPDGTRLIFELRRYEGEPEVEIDTININGTGLKTLVSYDKWKIPEHAAPTYSPVGSKIAFLGPSEPATGGGYSQLYIANADGSDLHAITNLTNVMPEEQPRFSPDGTKIAFSGCLVSSESCSRIYTINTDGTDLTEVTHGNEENEEWEFEPEWTPDGSKIVYGYEVGGFGKLTKWELYATNPDGSEEGKSFLSSLPGVSETYGISFSP